MAACRLGTGCGCASTCCGAKLAVDSACSCTSCTQRCGAMPGTLRKLPRLRGDPAGPARSWPAASLLHYELVAGNTQMLSLVVNGSPHECRSPVSTVADLLRELALEGKRVAVERNGEIVPRGLHALTSLAAGDRIEVVAAVGGG